MARRLVVFLIALVVWVAYFYGVDWLIMEAQGLPLRWTLMPAS